MITPLNFPVLCLGYGNLDREDDGVAWHVLLRLANRLQIHFPTNLEDFEFQGGGKIDLHYSLQLYPEMAEWIGAYPRLCFIDAHTGAVPEELHVENVIAAPQTSPFTHHLTPAALLSLSSKIYQHEPAALLVSVRGYSFQFTQALSPKTDQLANRAVEEIIRWMDAS